MCSKDYDFMLQQALLNCAEGIYKLFMQNKKGRVLNGPRLVQIRTWKH